jgi:hypothetical protein
MNETFRTPTNDEMAYYLARAQRERSEAFVRILRWLRSLLHVHGGTHTKAPKTALSAR